MQHKSEMIYICGVYQPKESVFVKLEAVNIPLLHPQNGLFPYHLHTIKLHFPNTTLNNRPIEI